MELDLYPRACNFEASEVRLGSGQQTLIASCKSVGEFIGGDKQTVGIADYKLVFPLLEISLSSQLALCQRHAVYPSMNLEVGGLKASDSAIGG